MKTRNGPTKEIGSQPRIRGWTWTPDRSNESLSNRINRIKRVQPEVAKLGPTKERMNMLPFRDESAVSKFTSPPSSDRIDPAPRKLWLSDDDFQSEMLKGVSRTFA